MVKRGRRYCRADKAEILDAAAQLQVRDIARTALESPTNAADFLRTALAPRDSECFAALWLDTRHRVLAFDVLFTGTLDGAAVYPREVAKRALERNAAACIVAHNHPAGILEPSHADEIITMRLRDALALLDVRVLDHIIVSAHGALSFAERGLL
jgi:DNA repair protein RadC